MNARILLIDDDPKDRLQTMQVLREGEIDAEFLEVAGRQDFETYSGQADFDLVITEFKLSWTDGLQLLKALKARYHCIPVIMLTANGDEEIAAAGMKAGLADYLPKRRRQRLAEVAREWLASRDTYCKVSDEHVRLCEKWDLAISRLTSDYAYSMRIEPDGRLTCEWVTEPFTRIMGYSLESVRSRTDWLAPVFPDDRPLFAHWLAKLRAGSQDACEYRILDRDGQVHWVQDRAIPVRDWIAGKVLRIYGAAQDITSRRKVESELRLMLRAIESSNNGIIITGPAGEDFGIIYANSAFQKMTGYSQEELLGRNCRILQGDDRDQADLENLRSALLAGHDGYAVLRNYRKDGSMFWNEIYVSPLADENGRITHFVGVQNNVTERKQAEDALRELSIRLQTAREEERTRISREIHDQFGSLLASLKLDVRWLSRRIGEADSTQREKVAEMSRLIDEAMQSVRKISTELRPSILDNLGLLPAVEWLVKQFLAHSGITGNLTIPSNENIGMESERATAVFRILQEALTNISLHAHASRVDVAVEVDEQKLTLTVKDDGCGIPRQKLATPDSHGILGMRARAESFGGKLKILSKPKAGTTLLLQMPLR
jgi:PAS domain S-box-containing protein